MESWALSLPSQSVLLDCFMVSRSSSFHCTCDAALSLSFIYEQLNHTHSVCHRRMSRYRNLSAQGFSSSHDPKFSDRVNSLAEQQRRAMRQNKSKIHEAVINIQMLEAQAERHSRVRERTANRSDTRSGWQTLEG